MDQYHFRQTDNYKIESEPVSEEYLFFSILFLGQWHMLIEVNNNKQIRESPRKTPSKRGRKPAKVDVKAKLERSRQSARECRARKKLRWGQWTHVEMLCHTIIYAFRYQYLEELVSSRERAIIQLRDELERVNFMSFHNSYFRLRNMNL